MLDKRQRLVATQALTNAYHAYRDLSIQELCRREKIFIEKDPGCEAYGSYSRAENLGPNYHHHITLQPGMPNVQKRKTFWHEVGHLVLDRLSFFPSYVGYHAYLYEFTNDHWEHERLAEAFATAMMLYRSGIEPDLSDTEAFFFADETSLTCGQMMRFNARRIESYCEMVRSKRRTIDLAGLEHLIRILREDADRWAVQPDLPMGYVDVHREPSNMKYHWVDWFRDWKHHNALHGHKESWRERSPDEVKLARWEAALCDRHKHWQLALFEERARSDRAKFKKSLRLFERARKKYINP